MARVDAVVGVSNRPKQTEKFVEPFAPNDLRREMHAGTPVAVLAVVISNDVNCSC